MSSPKILPKKKPVDKKVFLDSSLWEELTEIAEFHTGVFAEMGEKESVSRNDVIAAFLEWAVKEYWKDQGGRPTSDKERVEKTRRHAESIIATKHGRRE